MIARLQGLRGKFSYVGSENETYLLALHLRQCGFGLGQPEGHVHGPVEVDGGGQGGAGLLSTAGLAYSRPSPW